MAETITRFEPPQEAPEKPKGKPGRPPKPKPVEEKPAPIDDGFPSAAELAVCAVNLAPVSPGLQRFHCSQDSVPADPVYDFVEAIHPVEALKLWQAKRGIVGFAAGAPAPVAQVVGS